jgi:hypothetical protein
LFSSSTCACTFSTHAATMSSPALLSACAGTAVVRLLAQDVGSMYHGSYV